MTPSDQSMVEKVARALLKRSLEEAAERTDEEGDQSAWTLARPDELKRHIDYWWPLSEADARAAISAMREPTEAMKQAPLATITVRPGKLAPPEAYWRAMIDAALGEQK